MGHFLNIAYQILMEQGQPLTARELTEIGLRRGCLRTSGTTPSQTMKSKLSTDILTNKGKSTFMRTDEGKFALRQWHTYEEYIADRFSKGLLQEDVIVFPASSIKRYISVPGLHPIVLDNGQALLQECKTMKRVDAELDFSVIQLISVFVLRYGKRYLTYKRTKRLPESRLHGLYSMIFGGHINPDEALPLFNIFEPQYGETFLLRELGEEVRFEADMFPLIHYKGLLYDDSKEVSRQHLGIVYDVFLKSPKYEIGERGFLMDSRLETLNDINQRLQDFENWSQLVAQYESQIKNYSCDNHQEDP
ncbi:MAG: HTH domain-containing protein [Deltaproteobacteria bacterium]